MLRLVLWQLEQEALEEEALQKEALGLHKKVLPFLAPGGLLLWTFAQLLSRVLTFFVQLGEEYLMQNLENIRYLH